MYESKQELSEQLHIMDEILNKEYNLRINDNKTKLMVCDKHEPVSYTHLDVYKRQISVCVCVCVRVCVCASDHDIVFVMTKARPLLHEDIQVKQSRHV